MRKFRSRLAICLTISALVWCAMLIRDRKALREELIRFHVVANSDSEVDQAVKLRVRDAVLESMKDDLASIGDVEAAKAYLAENLPKIEAATNSALEKAGFAPNAVATLCMSTFDTRQYDTFSLPAGIYETLRITIGEGKGHNWWCVTFPSLCLSATAADFEETAVEAGLSENLSATLAGKQEYRVRFFLLDAMGTLENIFFDG